MSSKKSLLILLTCTFMLILLVPLSSAYASKTLIKNPYYCKPVWKLWFEDPSPITLQNGQEVSPPSKLRRIYPSTPSANSSKDFLAWSKLNSTSDQYAGLWDDVYCSMDNRHSFISDAWHGKYGNSIQGIREAMISLVTKDIIKAGANLTSQSTTYMGHHIANNATRLYRTERLYYFADVLRSGPAHISYIEPESGPTKDHYQALSPIYYNSIGSSGSETQALTKMVIAGAYLSRELKNQLKRNGLYPSTLLYLWKAGLPYKAPYAHELRHRIAYVSLGDQGRSKAIKRLKAHRIAYFYDNTLHLKNMVQLANGLNCAPPEVIFTVIRNSGGKVVYFLKKTIFIRQKPKQDIQLRISLNDSYDLQDREMEFSWKVLYGHRNISIKRDGQSNYYNLNIPYEKNLPRGRTAIVCTASNGKTQGNPAVLNIYRDWGDDNQRPDLQPIADQTVQSGETLKVKLKAADPEGFPVIFTQWSGEVGKINGDEFIWKCPDDHPAGQKSVTIIASDRTNGNCYAANRFAIKIINTD